MSDEKVVSLDRFRKKKEEQVQQEEEAARPLNHDDGKMGTMIWLHCPTCGTLEYTYVVAPQGRSHKCGTQVEEDEVSVDLRAELTLALINIGKIQEIRSQSKGSSFQKLFSKQTGKVLDQLEQSEMIYLDRIKKAAIVKIDPYQVESEDDLKGLPIMETNPIGLYISEFRFQPEKRFQHE